MSVNPKSLPPPLPHRFTLDERGALTVTGVREILRCDEDLLAMRVGESVLVARGAGIRLRQLAPEQGAVEAVGRFDSLGYVQAAARGGFLRRLFG